MDKGQLSNRLFHRSANLFEQSTQTLPTGGETLIRRDIRDNIHIHGEVLSIIPPPDWLADDKIIGNENQETTSRRSERYDFNTRNNLYG